MVLSSQLAGLENRSVLVTGATGMQGGSVARTLIHAGASVSALVRDPHSGPAKELTDAGIQLTAGDLDDYDSLRAACHGHDAVFSVQLVSGPTNPNSEQEQGANLIRAARTSGVSHFVHSSVSGTGWRQSNPHGNSGGMDAYWDSKEAVETAVREGGLPTWTIMKPAFFMDNLVEPKVANMFPLLAQGEILVACSPDTTLAMVSGEDFGKAVSIAIANPADFSEAEVELASDVLTFPQIAEVYSDVFSVPIHASTSTAEAIEARLGHRTWTGMQIWLEAVGYPARPEHAAAFGINLETQLHDWLAVHR